MNTNELKGSNNEKQVEQKPLFVTSNAKVFTNLHNAAAEKAAKIINISPNAKNINQFIINTGLTDDGRTIADKVEKNINAKVRFFGKKFEVGIVLELANVEPILTDDAEKIKEIKNKNKKEIDAAKDLIFRGLKEYFNWFSGESNISINDLVEFTPEYNSGRVQIDGGEIKGVEDMEAKQKMFFKKVRKDVDDTEKMRIGFKVGYTIKY